jgi:hypothetical protein
MEEIVMSQVIRISDNLYKRLEAHASGFDTPSNVIEIILNAYEGNVPSTQSDSNSERNTEIQPASNLDIVYSSESEESFKQELLANKKAYIKLYYTNGSSEIKEWNASRFSSTSRVDGNLRSGYLRGWKERGIFKAELAVNRNEIA